MTGSTRPPGDKISRLQSASPSRAASPSQDHDSQARRAFHLVARSVYGRAILATRARLLLRIHRLMDVIWHVYDNQVLLVAQPLSQQAGSLIVQQAAKR